MRRGRKRENRRSGRVLIGVGLFLASAGVAAAVWSSLNRRPTTTSVLFVVVDTLRADHLGAYGSRRDLTPVLDALARESYVFESAIATSSWTKSSIASMFTSRFPTSIGVLGRKDAIPESATTIAQILQRRGYQTYGVTTNGNAGESFGFARGFDAFVYPKVTRRYPGGATMFPAEGVTTAALEWLGGRDRARPFFLFLHYTDPHDPYFPHPDLAGEAEPPGRFDGSRAAVSRMDRVRREQLTAADLDRIRHLYAGEVRYCDVWLGKLVAGLRELGLWDDLTVVVTADHGEGLWDHGRRAHGRDLYEEMIRVPLLLRLPRMRPGDGRRAAWPVSLVDLAPTLLAAARVPIPPDFEGQDLWPRMRGRGGEENGNGIYSELDLDGFRFEAVRTDAYKIIRDRSRPAGDEGSYELFDLSVDPGETHDRMVEERDVALRLRGSLGDWRQALARRRPDAGARVAFDALGDDDLRSMRALGYLSDEEVRELQRQRRSSEGAP